MRAEKVVASLLDGNSSVTAIVGQRIYGLAAGEDVVAPLLVYFKQSASRPDQLDHLPEQQVDALIEVRCIATSYPQLKDLAEAVRVALVGTVGVIAGVNVLLISIEEEGADGYDVDAREFFQPWTFRVQHTE